MKLPVIPNSPLVSLDEDSKIGDFELRINSKLNFIENALFENDLIEYNINYQNSQSNSIFFQKHMLNIYDILKKNFPKSSKVIEIGCGKGEFFEIMENDKYFHAKGYDKTYEGTNKNIHKRYIKSSDKIKCDLIILRHTLEHIHRPHIFLKLLKKVFQTAYIFIEVPEMDWIIKNAAFYDITYEHVNYFNKESLTNLFDNKYREWNKVFGDQYQYIIANISDLSSSFEYEYNSNNWENLNFKLIFPELSKTINDINSSLNGNGKLYVWGSATKGAMFLMHCKSNESLFKKVGFAIDINPSKIGKYLPGSKVQIRDKDTFYRMVNSNDLLIVSNPNYFDEIKNDIKRNTSKKFRVQSL